MPADNFTDLGKVEAIARLYEGTPFSPFSSNYIEVRSGAYVTTVSKLFQEGLDFDLVYFPLKHLGHKSVTQVTGELLVEMSRPYSLDVVLGISSKLDFEQVSELWGGIVSAAKEYGYKGVSLDLVPSINGLTISVSAMGETPLLTGKRRSAAHSKDLVCISGSLGAAYFGMRVLEREKKAFEKNESEHPSLETYKMLVGAYLKPELDCGVLDALEQSEIYPSFGYFVTKGLSEAVRRLNRDSGLGVKIYADRIPFEGNSFQLGKELNVDPVSAAMNGGDDCRLLFTIPILELEHFRRDFQTFDIIGHLSQPEVGSVLVTPDGVELPIKAQGWNNED